jgi:hypothetical protein
VPTQRAVNACAGDEAIAKLGKETGHPERLATLVVDTSKPESIEAAGRKLEAEYAGRLGGLVSNAGVRVVVVTGASEGTWHHRKCTQGGRWDIALFCVHRRVFAEMVVAGQGYST